MLIAFIFFVTFLLLLNLCETLRYKISPYPSNYFVKYEVICYLKKQEKIKKICDLGAGFGFFSVKLARSFPEKKILAIEAAVIPFFVLKFLKMYYHLNNLEIKKVNFFKLNKIDSECVFCFLYPDKNEKIASHLKNILKKNTLVISSTFHLNLPMVLKKRMLDVYQTPVYYYQLA